MYDDDSRVALNPRLFTKPWSLAPSDSRKFSFGQCGRRPGVGTPSNIMNTLHMSLFFAKPDCKPLESFLGVHCHSSSRISRSSLSTVPRQMKSYHKRGVVRSNFLERRECFGYDLPAKWRRYGKSSFFESLPVREICTCFGTNQGS